MLEISFERQREYDKDVHYPVLFNNFLEKLMQRALRHVHSLENDCFAEEAEETDTPLSSVSTGG